MVQIVVSLSTRKKNSTTGRCNNGSTSSTISTNYVKDMTHLLWGCIATIALPGGVIVVQTVKLLVLTT